MADYVAPKASGKVDYIGGFVLTAGLGADELAKTYLQNNDDYTSIMVKALADRLAESLAEKMHQKVRKELWGYSPNEQFNNQELIKEKYQGIRPAPGYPACPDHTEKTKLFQLLNAKETVNVHLTEHYAMHTSASVSGWYFSHHKSNYFSTGKINKDQIISLSKRKQMKITELEKWLSPILGYIP